ncbi:MAG: glutamine-hydrolyzing carbamoyl-phosphate synthase small subunit [Arenicellales bacterium]|nr:glutamine-hydrolyzing carbamoyl-phosphate synthase small subunit [Arenicellales bacterium]MDP6550799.1 glutamine-hydrolyzing carbamoyl-phosphate synthase small subunit [Arenicellales bacterium]MDP6791627.1 glutamine-hydrolyzing carbamoyl-phosphate synthase small subunit [Arenicellales bacterium]MDP6917666.1 glutamine-hydrolyzing carbamoyl-phosphate synthase small subunit [Arenicellales bacterium]
MTPAILALEDGTVFHGRAIGAIGETVGEVVFNTAMTGYQEIVSDPSYARQIVTLTCPHIGNVGANDEDIEAKDAYACGLVVRDYPNLLSNFRSQESLSEYLSRQNVVGISDIDTRQLTRVLREKGAQNGCVQAGSIDEDRAVTQARAFAGLKGMDLARTVTTEKPYLWEEGTWQLEGGFQAPGEQTWRVVAYDFGIKRNILRLLVDRGCAVEVVPAQTSAKTVLARKPDGVFLSNGPGDPEPCTYAIEAIRQILKSRVPVFGICLGHQLLGLAAGAKTLKMKFGHHGANHPVADLATARVMITSQNHGFALDPDSLPEGVTVTHRSLFDQSIQGITLRDAPAFSFQGHPEASPGPQDIVSLFDQFIDLMAKAKDTGHAQTN